MYHKSKYAIPDFTLSEVIQLHYGYQLKEAPSNSVMCQCPLHDHTPKGEKALRIYDPPGTHTPKHGGFVCPRGVSGNAWSFFDQAMGLPQPGDDNFDETVLFLYNTLGEEPILREDFEWTDRDRALSLLRDIDSRLETVYFEEENNHYCFDEDRKEWLYRGVDPIIWLEYGVGMLSPTALDSLIDKHGTQAFEDAGISSWNKIGLDWLTEGVMIMRYSPSGLPKGLGVRRYEELTEYGSLSVKYAKNSGQSLTMDTRSYIFGLDGLRGQEPDVCYVVEGELDALALRTRGLNNVIARGGGTPSRVQTERMQDLGWYYVFIADSDPNQAGFDSIAAAAEHFPASEFILLPGEDTDPDEYVQEHGVEALLELPRETSLGIAMMAEEGYSWNKDRWLTEPDAIAHKYMQLIAENPFVHDEQDVELVAHFADKDPDYLKSWLFYERNRLTLPDRPAEIYSS